MSWEDVLNEGIPGTQQAPEVVDRPLPYRKQDPSQSGKDRSS